MKTPGIVVFLYLLGAVALLVGTFSLIGGMVDGNIPAVAIGVTATMEGAILFALGKIISLLANK
jgi:hypothetical protein